MRSFSNGENLRYVVLPPLVLGFKELLCQTGVSRRSSSGRGEGQEIREKENGFEENRC
jgi:hypothetical protein